MSHYPGRRQQEASEARTHQHRHHRSGSDHDHGSERRHRQQEPEQSQQYPGPAPEASARQQGSAPHLSPEDMNYGREVLSQSHESYLLWDEGMIRECRAQAEMMVAQNYAEKCQKIILDELVPLKKELGVTPDNAWPPGTEGRIVRIIRLVPYAERQRLKAENCYMSTAKHCLHSVGARDKLLTRSVLIKRDCETLRKGLQEWKDRRGGR